MFLQPAIINHYHTEAYLVQQLMRYDNKAYEHLYQHYKGAFYQIIVQIIPEKEIAVDVLQEVFVTVWQQIDKYDATKGRLFTWLLRVTRNTAINKTRSKLYKSETKNETLSVFVHEYEDELKMEQRVNTIGLREQVHRLKEEYRNVIELSYFNGYTQEEVAKALGIPIGTVKTRLRRAVLELKKQFT